MARTLLTVRSVHDQLYDYALSSAFRSAWVYDPSYALHREPDIWEMVRNDANTSSSIDRSSRAIIRPWRVEAFDGSRDITDRQMAQVMQDAFKHIDRFNARRRRISEARLLGRTYAVSLWRQRRLQLGGLPEADWWIPTQLVDVDRRRFHWVVDWDATRQNKTGIHLEMYDTDTGMWKPVPQQLRDCLIENIYNDTEDRVGYGRGMLEAIYFAHYMKTVTFEKISQGIDRWANGIWIGKIDGLRAASEEKTNEDLRLGMEAVLQDMRSNNQAVIENVDDIKVIETSGTGHQISMDFLHYLDDSVERLLNGSLRPSGHGSDKTGARAQAETESDTSEEFYQDDREDNDAIIQRDLGGSFLRYNRQTIEEVGLGKARIPIFTSEQIKKQDPERALAAITQAIQFVPVGVKEIYEKGEISRPLPDEEVVGPLGAGGGMGMGDPGMGGAPGMGQPGMGQPEVGMPGMGDQGGMGGGGDALTQGQQVEMEHTDDPNVARQIAQDHLDEDPDYYTKLQKMESGASPGPLLSSAEGMGVSGEDVGELPTLEVDTTGNIRVGAGALPDLEITEDGEVTVSEGDEQSEDAEGEVEEDAEPVAVEEGTHDPDE